MHQNSYRDGYFRDQYEIQLLQRKAAHPVVYIQISNKEYRVSIHASII